MAKGSRRKDDRQLDLFDAPVVMPAPSDNVQAPVKVPPIDPAALDDARLVEALAAASLQDVQAIVAQVVARRPLGWEGAALRLWVRYLGFGFQKPMLEQVAVLDLVCQTQSRTLFKEVIARGPIGESLDAELLCAAAACHEPLAQDMVMRGLSHPSAKVRHAAITIAVQSGVESSELLPCLSDASHDVRRTAAIEIASTGDGAARDLLIYEMRQQPDQEGLEALAFVANEDVVIRLGQIARQHPDWTPTVLGVLEAIGGPVATKVAGGLMG
jgi:HEAT repeat protein